MQETNKVAGNIFCNWNIKKSNMLRKFLSQAICEQLKDQQYKGNKTPVETWCVPKKAVAGDYI